MFSLENRVAFPQHTILNFLCHQTSMSTFCSHLGWKTSKWKNFHQIDSSMARFQLLRHFYMLLHMSGSEHSMLVAPASCCAAFPKPGQSQLGHRRLSLLFWCTLQHYSHLQTIPAGKLPRTLDFAAETMKSTCARRLEVLGQMYTHGNSRCSRTTAGWCGQLDVEESSSSCL